MRVCVVSKELSPWHGAGIGTYALNMLRAWVGAGHEAHVLTHPHRGLVEAGGGVSGEAWRVLGGAGVHVIEGVPSREAWFVRDSRAVRRALEALHAEHRFDVIEFADYLAEGYESIRARHERGALAGAVLAVRLHTPTRTCRLINGEPVDRGGEIDELDAREYAALGGADVLISPSRSLLAIVERRMAEIGVWDEGRPRGVVPYPFDVGAYARELGVEGVASGGGTSSVLYVGRLEHRKGVDLLVSACVGLLERGVDVHVRLIGGDTMTGPGGTSMRRHLGRLIGKRHRGRMLMRDSCPRGEVGRFMREATVVCVPSRWDNFPNVCLEAMSLGCCVVAADAGGLGEIIEDGVSGVLAQPRDVESLREALGRALGDDGLRRRVSDGAPARVAALCDPNAVVKETVRVIEGARGWVGRWREPVVRRGWGRLSSLVRGRGVVM